jgi:hypothetical protein
MNKIWLLAVLGACTANAPTTSLAELNAKFGAPHIEVVASVDQVNIELHVTETTGCPTLADNVVATFDGQPMDVARGGYDLDGSGCYPIAFWFNSAPMAAILSYEAETKTSQLVVADPGTTWNIQTTRLLSNDFEIDATASQIVWEDVTSITSAQVSNSEAIIVGNAIDYTPGAMIDWVNAYAHPVPTLCAGPALCTVDLSGARSWNGTPN